MSTIAWGTDPVVIRVVTGADWPIGPDLAVDDVEGESAATTTAIVVVVVVMQDPPNEVEGSLLEACPEKVRDRQ